MKKLILYILVVISICYPAYSAELLVINKSCSAPSCMKAGDIASIHEDGTKWEEVCKKCVPPMWKIVKLPGVAVKDLQYLLEPLTEEGKDGFIRERKYKLPTELMNATYDAKGKLAVPSKDAQTAVASISAKELTAEKEAISVEVSR